MVQALRELPRQGKKEQKRGIEEKKKIGERVWRVRAGVISLRQNRTNQCAHWWISVSYYAVLSPTGGTGVLMWYRLTAMCSGHQFLSRPENFLRRLRRAVGKIFPTSDPLTGEGQS